jgi:hypothetical protein
MRSRRKIKIMQWAEMATDDIGEDAGRNERFSGTMQDLLALYHRVVKGKR